MSGRDDNQDSQDSFDVEIVQLVFKETKDLIRALEGTAASRVTIKVGAVQIEVERGDGAIMSGEVAPAVARDLPTASPPFTPGIMPVVAPLVGIFYRAPSPGAKPFVEVGDTVERGQKVSIIEAMKVMNEVTSDYHGVVTEILVENGEAVQYEQRLMLIDTAVGTT